MGRDRLGRRVGFTIVELMIAMIVVSLVLGIVMTIYSKSNKYAAKGNWRVQTTAKQRLALRQVKDFLEKSSYPAVIRVSNYTEASPDFGDQNYVMNLGAGKPVSSTTGSYMQFEQPGDVLTFYACTPRQELEGVSTAINAIPGHASKYVLSLEAQAAQGTTATMRLLVTSSTADVTLNGDKVQVGGFANEKTTRLLDDVAEVQIGMDGNATDREKTALQFFVICSDPFDGRLRVRETAKAVINVRIKK